MLSRFRLRPTPERRSRYCLHWGRSSQDKSVCTYLASPPMYSLPASSSPGPMYSVTQNSYATKCIITASSLSLTRKRSGRRTAAGLGLRSSKNYLRNGWRRGPPEGLGRIVS